MVKDYACLHFPIVRCVSPSPPLDTSPSRPGKAGEYAYVHRFSVYLLQRRASHQAKLRGPTRPGRGWGRGSRRQHASISCGAREQDQGKGSAGGWGRGGGLRSRAAAPLPRRPATCWLPTPTQLDAMWTTRDDATCPLPFVPAPSERRRRHCALADRRQVITAPRAVQSMLSSRHQQHVGALHVLCRSSCRPSPMRASETEGNQRVADLFEIFS